MASHVGKNVYEQTQSNHDCDGRKLNGTKLAQIYTERYFQPVTPIWRFQQTREQGTTGSTYVIRTNERVSDTRLKKIRASNQVRMHYYWLLFSKHQHGMSFMLAWTDRARIVCGLSAVFEPY